MQGCTSVSIYGVCVGLAKPEKCFKGQGMDSRDGAETHKRREREKYRQRGKYRQRDSEREREKEKLRLVQSFHKYLFF